MERPEKLKRNPTRANQPGQTRRDCLKTLVAGLATGTQASMLDPTKSTASESPTEVEASKTGQKEWDGYNQLFKRKIRRCIEVGFHYHDLGQFDGYYSEILSKFDPKEIVANLVRANADSCHLWAEAVHCYYYEAEDTELGHKHKSLRGRDLFGELAKEAKKQGLSVLAYSSLNSSLDFARRHPDSVMKDAAGTPIRSAICFNHVPFLEALERRSSELMDKYEVDGWFFDGTGFPMDRLACFCDTCRMLFRKQYGTEMPSAPARDETWAKFLEFRYDSNSRFARRLKEYLHSKYRGRIVCFNYHGHIPFGWKEALRPVGHGTISDATTAEDFAFRFSQSYPSLTASFLAGLRPGAAFQVMTDMTLGGYGDFTQRPVADLKWDLFTAKMRGANVMVIEKILHDYSVRPAVYEMIGNAFGEVKEKEAYFDHPPVKEVGLYYSLRTRDWYDQHNPDAYERCVVGAYRALVDLHYQVEFLFDESATLERLQQFPVIYLPNAAILTEGEAQMLRQYVAAGGSLLATWETGLYEPQGRLKDFTIRDVLGVRYAGHVEQVSKTIFGAPDPHVEHWNFVRFGNDPWTQDVHAGLDLPIFGAQAILIESDGAQTFGELRTALPGGRAPGTAGCSPWKTVGPALAIHPFGKGKSAYFPLPLDWQYASQRALPDHRNLIRNALRYLHPNREATVEAPVNVESVVMRGRLGGEFIVHLVALWPRKNCKTYWLAPAPTTEFMEEPARYRATITFWKKVRHVRALSSETAISSVGSTVRIETGQVHETLIIST